MKLKFFSLMAAVALVLAMTSPAKADTCAVGQLDLMQSLLGGGTAEACLDQGTDTLTLTNVFFNGTDTAGKVFTIAWMGSADAYGDTSGSSTTFADDGNTWNDMGSGNADGWGSYDHVWTAQSVSSDNFTVGNTITWTFTGDPGTDITLHIGSLDAAPSPSCSVWVSTRWSEGQNTNTNPDCGGAQVPEPGSLMLFGTGLLGMAGFLRRKLLG
jgi:hypothetical protein